MSSGSFTSPGLDFNNTGKPGGPVACATADAEPRGPERTLAGLCVACGRATIHRDADGNPRHLQPAPLPACAVCDDPMKAYRAGQVAHPNCEPA